MYILVGVVVALILVFYKRNSNPTGSFRTPQKPFPDEWKKILFQEVDFYKALPSFEKRRFEKRVHIFLLNVKITGVRTTVDHTDRILIAAGGVIPLFGFEKWHYMNLKEVLLYPDSFEIPGSTKQAKGLVGWGAMKGKMMLSKKALRYGYTDQTDQKNVVIHEFIHILDMQDGKTDGVLAKIMKDVDLSPWLHIIQSEMYKIHTDNSTIRDYGKENNAEFLAVVSEYFFESPEELKTEHPALFSALDSIFNPPRSMRSRRNW